MTPKLLTLHQMLLLLLFFFKNYPLIGTDCGHFTISPVWIVVHSSSTLVVYKDNCIFVYFTKSARFTV